MSIPKKSGNLLNAPRKVAQRNEALRNDFYFVVESLEPLRLINYFLITSKILNET